ncbi:MBL fold metallo-hydrolase [Tuwongella immobilis]|uniref:: Lactamase_B n=1 Tax=Tuwongella immobilis TaxID=692036 RepID=A0A6C2YII1_9BACT|nr:MBL fold metallo-hydrolase [Tuwongella immobilis]VIP00885.1 : Lactamase_B [Tuwongella immobilis]VTR97188.1 : Lactamase_B [Tuwongella immobilis]
MQSWFDGVHLLGRYNPLRTGCWLLEHQGEAAILEMPPTPWWRPSPAVAAQAAVERMGLRVKYLLCTHSHMDHYSRRTLSEMRRAFPAATVCLHESFQASQQTAPADSQWITDESELNLSGEPLLLVHAPKHSTSDTMVIFRGAICTGDWELNTIRSVHDSWTPVPRSIKLKSIDRMIDFVQRRNYHIHRVYSVHANDRREQVDFVGLMHDTRVDRKFW